MNVSHTGKGVFVCVEILDFCHCEKNHFLDMKLILHREGKRREDKKKL